MRPASWARSSPPIPEQFFAALPYVVTIVVLAEVVGRNLPSAGDGQTCEREAVM